MDFRDKNGREIKIGSKFNWVHGRYYATDEGTVMLGTVRKLNAKINKDESITYRMTGYAEERTTYEWRGVVHGRTTQYNPSFPSKDGIFRTIEIVEDAPENQPIQITQTSI